MDHFVNEYRYTNAVVQESVGAWWKWKCKKHTIAMWVAIPCILLIALVCQNKVLLLFALVPFVVLGMIQAKSKVGIRTEEERKKVAYPDEDPLLHVEIGEDILLQTQGNSRRIEKSNVEAVIETEHLLILCIKGMMTLALDKNGFLEGNAEQCLAEMNKLVSHR